MFNPLIDWCLICPCVSVICFVKKVWLCLSCFMFGLHIGVLASFGTILISLLYLAVSLSRTRTKDGYDYGVPPGAQWAMCLLSPVALALGMDRVSC